MFGFRVYIARSLLLVFSIILIPKEFIHDLYGHEDTRCIPGAQATLEPKHHHCAILQIIASVFNTPAATSLSPSDLIQKGTVITVVSSVTFPILFYYNLRAPHRFSVQFSFYFVYPGISQDGQLSIFIHY